ncbi:glycosyltransferase family 4 protein [Paucihalobacter sp.]|uniref:glycosyltransferase family 4 protein n=1 Tax=Paucihalobacter sp. TaxID=2850405 RepID=UPI003D160AD1
MYKVLISNTELPSKTVGSWTNRLTKLINHHPTFFNYILSPSNALNTCVKCKKRSFITWYPRLRQVQLQHWVAKEYIKALKRIIKKNETWALLVMDDMHLLEAIVWANKQHNWQAKITFSFHGFELNLKPELLAGLHQILFLSKLAEAQFLDTHHNYHQNTAVVGNAVDSKVFYALDTQEKIQLKKSLGYNENDVVLLWMAKDRPKKGFYIFKNLVELLWQKYPQLKVITIGTEQTLNHTNVKKLGILPNLHLAQYLKISNIYTFTTQYDEGFGLSMIEAYKCGNMVVASKLGAIPEVLKDLPNTYLIDKSSKIEDWFECCNDLISELYNNRAPKVENKIDIWEYDTWEAKFMNAIY